MSTHQEGAPHPADLNHLTDILAIAQAQLPQQATNITVTPATKFAERYPGGWGYVIAFTTPPNQLRTYVDKHTIASGNLLEEYDSSSRNLSNDSTDLADIQNPVLLALSTPPANAELILERPLGRGWLLIRGAPR
ncbi:MAG: hypothetical protein Q4D79_02455 [Propionibacteriaceae bacterium]|nr:hypothetical protein [Propionibacteriaceae bacterium]